MATQPSYIGRMSPESLITAEELPTRSPAGKCTELIRGRLVVREPPGGRHGLVAAELAYRINAHVKAHDLGRVFAAETGFKLRSNPDTVRAPDLAFISKERVPEPIPIGYPALAPDLVVEVLSPDDRPGEVLSKVGEWLEGGCRLVWVVDPRRVIARVYRADGTESLVMADKALDGEDVLPGFSCDLGSVF
jgi:Uma2 family endonuclease